MRGTFLATQLHQMEGSDKSIEDCMIALHDCIEENNNQSPHTVRVDVLHLKCGIQRKTGQQGETGVVAHLLS